MNNSAKIKSLVTIIIFLLITNIAMLIFFLAAGRPADTREKNREFNGMYNSLQSEVGFTKDQLDQYQVLRKEQRDKVRPLFNELRNAKKDFYKLIYSSSNPDSLINADADSIAQKQKALDMQMFRYFKNIRSICTTEQLPKFDTTVTKEIGRMVGGHPGNTKQGHSK
jgi:Spy/CpxP family protein refolding chaperone